MALLSLEFVTQIEYFEPHDMAATDEGFMRLRYYDSSIDDLMIFGSMNYSESLLPGDGRESVTDFEVSMSFSDSSGGTSTSIGDTRSIVELRADFMGIKRAESESAWFVFREPGSEDYGSRKGIMDVYPDHLPSGKSMEFLDWSRDFELGPLQDVDVEHHRWPGGKPYDSYYVTVEFEHSPGVLDDPPQKDE